MRKQIIATLVGALILFFWQFLSWSLLNVHGSEMQYTENQDAILETLSQHLEEGTYFLPTVPRGTSAEEMEAAMSDAMGKPWATVSYHPSMENNMATNMFRGFVVDLLAAFLLIWVLLKFENLTFNRALITSLAVGFIGYLTIPYLNSIWFESETIGYLVDAVVQWGLVGVWLGWYLPRQARPVS